MKIAAHKTVFWLRWGWAGAVACAAALLVGCGGLMVRPEYRPQYGSAVQSPYDVASPGDEIFTRESDAFPLATVKLPVKEGEEPKVESVLDVLKPATPSTLPAIPPPPPVEPVPTEVVGGPTTMPEGSAAMPTGETPKVAIPAKVVAQDKQVRDVTASTDASGNLDLFVTSATGIGSVTLEKTGENWPAKVNVHLGYGASKPLAEVSGVSASELLPSGGALPLKTTSSGSEVTVSIPGFTRNARIRIEWVDKYR